MMEELKERLEGGEMRSVFVTVEEWTYDFVVLKPFILLTRPCF